MQRKIFWITFLIFGTIADFALPLIWGFVAAIPIAIGCWWFAYRSGLFPE